MAAMAWGPLPRTNAAPPQGSRDREIGHELKLVLSVPGPKPRSHFDVLPAYERTPRARWTPALSLSLFTPLGPVLLAGCSAAGAERIVRAPALLKRGPVDQALAALHLIPLVVETAVMLARGNRIGGRAMPRCTGRFGLAWFGARAAEQLAY
jgi:hypothetical protein